MSKTSISYIYREFGLCISNLRYLYANSIQSNSFHKFSFYKSSDNNWESGIGKSTLYKVCNDSVLVSYTSPESWFDRNHGFILSHGRKHLIGEVFSWDFTVSNRYMVEGPPFLISKVPQEIPLLISCLPTCIEYREGLSNWLMIITEVSCTPPSRTRLTSVSSELNLLKKCQLDVQSRHSWQGPRGLDFAKVRSNNSLFSLLLTLG